MWIEELPSGKFKFVERYTVDGKAHRVSITTDKNTASVRKAMPAMLQEKLDKKLETTSSRMTFSDLMDEWFEIASIRMKSSTQNTTQQKMRKIDEGIGDLDIYQMKAHHINRFLLQRAQEVSYGYIKGTRSIVHRVLKFGFQQGYLTDTALLSVDVPEVFKTTRKKNDAKYLERDELDYVIHSIGNKEFQRYCIIMVNTGLRFGELAALNVSDIDFQENAMTISKNYDYSNDIITSPKTDEVRTVYFHDNLKPILTEQIQFMRERCMRCRIRDTDYLFVTTKGKPYHVETLNTHLRKIDIDKTITSHIFRHTYISLAVEDDVPLNYIAAQVGHSSLAMIEQIYQHTTEQIKKRQKNTLTNLSIHG